MHCADCERIDHLLHDSTARWLGMPSTESCRRLLALAGAHGWPVAAAGDERTLRLDLARAEVDRFVTALYGELKGPELADLRVVTTDGHAPGPANLARVMSGSVFVNRFKAGWLVDAIEAGRYTTWYQPTIAESQGIRTIAEGIETQDEAGWLIDRGVDYLQGYLYGRPAPLPAAA